MNENFLNYQQSLAVKELGFDEPTFFAFDNCNMRCSDLRTNEQKFNGVNYNSSTYTSQPLKSQFFKWAREKHSLRGFIGWRPNVKKWDFHVYDLNLSGKEYVKQRGFKEYSEDPTFDIYEQAEDACIDKIIELIKIK